MEQATLRSGLRRYAMAAACTALLLPASVLAVPLQLAHQGRLLDAEQAPLDGQHDLHFGLYDAADDGTLLWDETVTETFVGGYYSAVLGADDGNPLDDGIFATSPVYLELTVDGGDPLQPRQEINSVPYALRAATAENVEGGFVDASDISIDGDLVIDADGNWVGPTPPVDWADLSGVPGGLVDGEDADVLGGLSCSDGFVAKYDAGSGLWTCGADDVLDAAGVLAFVDGAVINLGAGSGMAGAALATLDDLAADTLAGLSCADGGVAKYDGTSGFWDCGTDLVLDSGDVLGMVAGATIDLGLGSAVGGVDIATLDDLDWAALGGLPPGFADDLDNDLMAELGLLCADGDRAAWDVGLGDWVCSPDQVGLDRLDTTTATAGQVLTFDGANVTWEEPASNASPPCTLVAVNEAAGGALLDCGTGLLRIYARLGLVQVSGGGNHTCGIDTSGSIRCWGDRTLGQAVPPLGTFAELDSGYLFGCGIDASGAVQCWGHSAYGQTSPPGGTFTDVSAGYHFACGVDSSSALQCWGLDNFNQTQPPAGAFVEVAAGKEHACAIDGSGAVECWGLDNFGQASAPPGVFTQVAAGSNHTCGLTAGGMAECWGSNDTGQSTPPSTSFIQISGGYDHTCGLASTGEVECWGKDNHGQSSPPPGVFVDVSAGDDHTCGVLETIGTAACWGLNAAGQSSPP